jgi:hypothetical protein
MEESSMKRLVIISLVNVIFGLTIGCAAVSVNAQESGGQAPASAAAAPVAGQYYRFWQGFKLTSLSQQQFIQGLPQFMQSTDDVYRGKGISNYLVAIPPSTKPAFMPDEFALVAFDNQQDYLNVKATPAGQAYINSHWLHFDQATSASAPMLTLAPQQLQFGISYDVLGQPVQWSQAYVYFFIGIRRASLRPADFQTQLSAHVAEVAAKLAPL